MSGVLASAEEEKKHKYCLLNCTVSFAPFLISVDGALGHKALMFLQHLVVWLSDSWDKRYSPGHVATNVD